MPDDDFSTEGHDCRPDFREMDGWCVTLFPLVDDKGVFKFDKCLSTDHRDAEISRVSFKYIRKYPDGSEKEFPMELWSGVIGVAEDEATFALTPQIGWFIRKSQTRIVSAMNIMSGTSSHKDITTLKLHLFFECMLPFFAYL